MWEGSSPFVPTLTLPTLDSQSKQTRSRSKPESKHALELAEPALTSNAVCNHRHSDSSPPPTTLFEHSPISQSCLLSHHLLSFFLLLYFQPRLLFSLHSRGCISKVNTTHDGYERTASTHWVGVVDRRGEVLCAADCSVGGRGVLLLGQERCRLAQ